MTLVIPPTEVCIVDATNPQRLLGYIAKRDLPTYRYDMIRVAVLEPMSVCSFRDDVLPSAVVNCRSVDLIAHAYNHDYWCQEILLKTYAPIDTLLMLGSFRLPGETQDEMKMRRHFRGH